MSADTRYRFGPVIGQGGSAIVHEAWEKLSGREVALKMLHPAVLRKKNAGQMLQRFMREATVMAAVRHPAMVRIYDFGLLDGVPFIAMERLYGRVLKYAIAQDGAFAPTRTWPLILGVLDALSLCHDKGIVHKDLKPENLFLTQATEDQPETLIVFDFGFAHDLEATRMSSQGKRYGTAHYLSPEYIEGAEPEPTMDVYQMGLVLGEMLTGRRLVAERSAVPAMERHLDGVLPELDPRLREGTLGVIFDHALALSPSERFPHARAFHDALAAIDPAGVTL